MSNTGLEEDDALLEASRQAYKTHAGLSQNSSSSSTAFTDGSDLVTFDSEIPNAPKSQHVSRPKQHTNDLQKSESPELSSSLDALERSGFSCSKKPSKREIQEVCLFTHIVPLEVSRGRMV